MNEIAVVRTYETLYIIDPNLTDEQIQAITEKYRNIVTQFGGEVVAVERWERRKLAYEIKGYREGIYILMYFKSDTSALNEVNRVMRISEDVIRHQILLEEANQAEIARERASRPQPKPAEAPAPAPVAEAPQQEEAAPAEEAAEAPAEPVAEEAPAQEATEAPAEETPAE